MGGGIIGLQRDRLLKVFFCLRQVPIEALRDSAEYGVRLAEVAVDLQCLETGRLAFRHHLAWWLPTIESERHISISQSSICQRVGWVLVDCLLIIVKRLQKSAFGSLVPIESSLQIKLVGL